MKRRSSTITLTLMTSVSLVACTESTEVSSTVDLTYEPTLVSSVLGAEKGSIDRLRYPSMTDCRNDWGADATLCVREAGQVVGPYMKRSGTQVNIIPTRSQNDPASARDYTGPQIDGSKTFNSLASGAVTLEHLNQNFTYYSFTAVRSGRLTASGAGGVRAHYPTRDACEGDWGKSDRPGFLTCFADGTTFAGPYFTQARPDQPVRFHYYLSDGAVSVLTAPAPDTIGVLPSGLLVTPFFAPSLQTSSGDRTPYVRDAYTWDPNSEAWSKLNVDAQRAVYTTPQECRSTWGEYCRSSGAVFYSPFFYGGYFYPYVGSSVTPGHSAQPMSSSMTRASAAAKLERLSINASAVRLPTATSRAPGTSTASTPGVTRGVFGAAARSGAS